MLTLGIIRQRIPLEINRRLRDSWRKSRARVARTEKEFLKEMTRILLYSDEPILAKGLESVLRHEALDLSAYFSRTDDISMQVVAPREAVSEG